MAVGWLLVRLLGPLLAVLHGSRDDGGGGAGGAGLRTRGLGARTHGLRQGDRWWMTFFGCFGVETCFAKRMRMTFGSYLGSILSFSQLISTYYYIVISYKLKIVKGLNDGEC